MTVAPNAKPFLYVYMCCVCLCVYKSIFCTLNKDVFDTSRSSVVNTYSSLMWLYLLWYRTVCYYHTRKTKNIRYFDVKGKRKLFLRIVTCYNTLVGHTIILYINLFILHIYIHRTAGGFSKGLVCIHFYLI